ncbi:MAG: radical SAM protein, partial [Candidatus Aminicenantes bacterium]|nr:radical SAM protein [Candidatus Aminicenantes bacterium]
CVIPRVRGRSRSVPPADAVGRLAELARQGFSEVVLTGIHLNSYGLDLRPESSLLGLLREMEERCGWMRLRLSSLDPRGLGRGLCEFLAGSPFVRPHFHLSLQHGSDRVLARMGRKSTAAEYRQVLNAVRRLSPEACLGADIITGFPGEFEEDFRATSDFLQGSPLNYFHVFSFSPRPGTAAAAWAGVDPAAAKRRTAHLRSLSAEKFAEFRRSFLGKTLEAVVIRKAGGRAELLTANYIKAYADAGNQAPGDAVRVTLDRVEERYVRGRIQE